MKFSEVTGLQQLLSITKVSVTVVRNISNTLKRLKTGLQISLISFEANSITETPLEGESKQTSMYHTPNILIKHTKTISQQCRSSSINLQYNSKCQCIKTWQLMNVTQQLSIWWFSSKHQRKHASRSSVLLAFTQVFKVKNKSKSLQDWSDFRD